MISKIIIDKMLRKGIIESPSDMAIYRYGIENGLSLLINLAISIFIALFMRKMVIFLLFITCYIPLRSYSGGWHFSSKKVCCIVSNLAIIIILLTNKILISYIEITFSLMGISIIYIWCIVQRNSDVRELEKIEKDVFDCRKKISLCIILASIIFFLIIGVKKYACAAMAAIILTAILVFIEQIQKNV